MTDFTHDPDHEIDLVDDQVRVAAQPTGRRNFSKVGSARPTTLFFTDGPGAIKDMPRFTVLPLGYDAWDRVWNKWPTTDRPVVPAPRLLARVRWLLGPQVEALRPYPFFEKSNSWDDDGRTMGVPAVVFPQWLRCTKCGRLARLSAFTYSNSVPGRPDRAGFVHEECKTAGSKMAPSALPARYLLVCLQGHLDEFPYREWVHHFAPCPKVANPVLRMLDPGGTAGSSARVECTQCGAKRGMNEAQGEAGKSNLPRCRGRHPHLDGYDASCDAELRLMLVGASNLWFPVSESVIVMPETQAEEKETLVADLRVALTHEEVVADLAEEDAPEDMAKKPRALRRMLSKHAEGIDLPETDPPLVAAFLEALTPGDAEEEGDQKQRLLDWDPLDLRVPEWRTLQNERPTMPQQPYGKSGLVLTERVLEGQRLPRVDRLVAVDQLRKVQALLGFTRIDEFSRVDDAADRLVRLSRDGKPKWTVATENRGEGMLITFDESAIASWEEKILGTQLWKDYGAANHRYYLNHLSATAKVEESDKRLQPPRFWLLHTLSHVLMREMAMHSGYASASLSERLYAWSADEEKGRAPAAGLMICTTAPDSDGTLGGLVALSDPDRFAGILASALRRAGRCSSDPICGNRVPANSEDFLHGAACHSCAMASETSCENANRALDRRMLLSLPGHETGFFGGPGDWA